MCGSPVQSTTFSYVCLRAEEPSSHISFENASQKASARGRASVPNPEATNIATSWHASPGPILHSTSVTCSQSIYRAEERRLARRRSTVFRFVFSVAIDSPSQLFRRCLNRREKFPIVSPLEEILVTSSFSSSSKRTGSIPCSCAVTVLMA